MLSFKDNLLAQFSVVAFVIMVILALVTSFILIEILNNNIGLLREHGEALAAGRSILPTDPFSIPSLSNQVSNLKWISLGAIGGSFVYLYATLVYLVWEGWKTIVRQRSALQQANQRLESRVDETGQDLKDALELEERRNAFVSIASHELRTPMTTIMGFSELLLKREAPEATRQDWLERIYQNSQILSAIVDDMLDVSRIQSGKLAIDLQHVQLENLIDEVLAGIREDANSHEFAVDVPQDTPEVVADKEKLSQVVINLLTNAVKYSPDGGSVTISAHHEDENERVVVAVADQGMGIAAEERDRLFNTFHRIRRPETEGIRGTGLGLSIVKGLVVMMRGDVWVESEINKGSKFFFTVPTKRMDISEGELQTSNDSGGIDGEAGAVG